MPPPLRLATDDLFSKWGFGDGDVVEDYLWDHVDEDLQARLFDLDQRAVLCQLVRSHLLPALDRPVEVYEIQTIHNPIRARSVAGLPVEEGVIYDPGAAVPFVQPEYVEIPFDVVRRAAGLEIVAGEVVRDG